MADETVAQVVVETLAEIGVRHVFGVPSGGWIDYMEALRRTDDIDFVLATHEGGAAFMATVCGRLTGVPGVCFGTFGPGATNLSTGVGCAFLDRSPVIATAGCIATHVLLLGGLLLMSRFGWFSPWWLLAFVPVVGRTVWGLLWPPRTLRGVGLRELWVVLSFTVIASVFVLS